MPTESARHRRIGDFTRTRRAAEREQGWDGEIGRLAEAQHGVVSWRQLSGLGLGKDAIQHRISAGRLRPLHRGIYSVGHRLIRREGRWMGAVLSSGPEAVLSYWSAAALWGIRPNSRSTIDITTPHGSRSWRHIRRHVSPLPPDEVTVEEGIPVTTVPRTILDLAATEPLNDLENMLREMEFLQLRDRLSLWDLVERYPGRRGVRKVTAALKRLKHDPPGRRRNPLEERFAPFCRRYRLPLPRFNDLIAIGGKNYEVDCHWPHLRQIVELDGWQAHGRAPSGATGLGTESWA